MIFSNFKYVLHRKISGAGNVFWSRKGYDPSGPGIAERNDREREDETEKIIESSNQYTKQ